MTTDLGFVMKQARIVREAYERGELTEDERSQWIADLKRPRGFWAWLLR